MVLGLNGVLSQLLHTSHILFGDRFENLADNLVRLYRRQCFYQIRNLLWIVKMLPFLQDSFGFFLHLQVNRIPFRFIFLLDASRHPFSLCNHPGVNYVGESKLFLFRQPCKQVFIIFSQLPMDRVYNHLVKLLV